MHKIIWILTAAFLAGLGVVIGTRMSTEAMGVVVGVVLGVAACIPMALLVMLFANRREERRPAEQPPVVINLILPQAPRARRPGQIVTHNGAQCVVGKDGGVYPLLTSERQ